jgi:hypothetical protein
MGRREPESVNLPGLAPILSEPNAGSVALSQLQQAFQLGSFANEEELSGGTIQPGLIKLPNRRA